MSFRLKTILGIAFIEAILLCVLIVSVNGFLRDSNEAQLNRYVKSTIETFASMIKDSVLGMDLARLQSFSVQLSRNPGIAYVRIWLLLPIPQKCKISPMAVHVSPLKPCSNILDRQTERLLYQYQLST